MNCILFEMMVALNGSLLIEAAQTLLMCEECERLYSFPSRRHTESLLFALLVFAMQNPLLEKQRAVPSAGKEIMSF